MSSNSKFQSIPSLVAIGVALFLSGCASYPDWIPASGPSVAQVAGEDSSQPLVPVVDIDDTVARRLLADRNVDSFAESLASSFPKKYVVDAGDTLEVSIWEAPPAVLFGVNAVDPRLGTSRQTSFPEQIVNDQGVINVPFAGSIKVSGKTPQQIEADIVQRLARKANQPQVLVRVLRNQTSNVTVVGEVTNSQRLPLTAKGERLLDAIAAVGGVRQPVGKTMIQISRGGKVFAMPLEKIIQDPSQNVYLQPGDVLTALFQSSSFTVLGAAGKNEEINFESQGITLAQALARSGGLRDNQADARGLFVFRFEDPEVLSQVDIEKYQKTPDGKIPVVYQMNLKDPRSFLVAQNFPMKNKDVVYVANAPAAELQKFLGILTSSIYSISNTINLSK